MKSVFRRLAAILILLTVLLSIVACDLSESKTHSKDDKVTNKWEDEDGTEEPTERPTSRPTQPSRPTEPPKQTDPPVYYPDVDELEGLDELDFEGEHINILVRNDHKVAREWSSRDVMDDELDVAVNARNKKVETDLNLDVNFIFSASGNWDDYNRVFPDKIIVDVDNKLHEIDVVASWGFLGVNAKLRDYYVNLYDSETLPYLDLSMPCWNQSLVENGTVNGQLYACSGDMNLSMIDTAMVLWHNKTLYQRERDADDPEDILDLVINGEWTVSHLYKWSQFFSERSGDCEDLYGLYLQGQPWEVQPNDVIPYAWDLELIKTNDDGSHSFNFSNNSRAENSLELFRSLAYGIGNPYGNGCRCGDFYTGHFATGKVVFFGDIIYWSESRNMLLRSMSDEHAAIPYPKYDEYQDSYGVTSQNYFNTVSVIDHSASSVPTKGHAVSAYLQYANEVSANVVEAYCNTVILPKYRNDEETVIKTTMAFLEIVANIRYDFGSIYSAMMANVMDVWTYAVYDDVYSVSDKFAENEDDYDYALYELERWFDSYVPNTPDHGDGFEPDL